MENIVIKGYVTNTSKKQDSKFKQQTPTKTAYLEVDEETANKLIEFGLRKYTPEDGGKDFFVIKFSANAKLYGSNTLKETPQDLPNIYPDTPNVKSIGEVGINIIKGENMGNAFTRIQAIKSDSFPIWEEIEAENPFAE